MFSYLFDNGKVPNTDLYDCLKMNSKFLIRDDYYSVNYNYFFRLLNKQKLIGFFE